MSNTLKIEIPKGFKVDSFDASTGEIKLMPIPLDIKERIKNFDDVLRENGIEIQEFRNSLMGLPKDEAAYKQVKEIVKAFNEGWTPDWTDSSQYKYYPWFKMGSPSGGGCSFHVFGTWRTGSCVGSRLCFETREKAIYAGEQFEELYKSYFVKA
jgi:phage antirepressor YoqD-like protein